MIDKRNIFKAISSLALALGLSACTADYIDMPDNGASVYDADTQLVLNVMLPRSIQESTTRAESDPTSDECKVTSLRMIAFSESGNVENRALPVPSEVPVADDATSAMQIKNVQPGNYRIYVIANMPEERISTVRSENELKQIVLDYSSTLPQAGSLPMIYEPGAMTFIPAEGTETPTVQTLSMKFTCVKMRYSLVFDKSFGGTSDIFGDKGLIITDVNAELVSKSSKLVLDKTLLPEGRTIALGGSYYDNFVDNPSNASVNNADVIVPTGAALSKPTSPTQKWVWHGTVYLPERYATSSGQQTRLVINGYVTDESGAQGNVTCKYELPLGGYAENPSSKELPRNTYYEVIGRIESLGAAQLEATIVAKDWMEQNLPSDFVHTFLKLSKTELNVTSLEDDLLVYSTDGRGGVEVVCETKLPTGSTNPVLIFSEDQLTHQVTVKANPAVDILALSEAQRKGDARCYVKAGNIKKYFTVHYDIAPFFTIEPVALKIQYSATTPELNSKVFEYRTNLGGVLITGDNAFGTVYIGPSKTNSTVSLNGKSISLQCANPSSPVGTITVTSNNHPGTTLVFELDAFPRRYSEMNDAMKNSMTNKGKEDLSVTVMPPLGGYRIYFRSINDYHCGYQAQSTTTEFLTKYDGTKVSFPTEGGNNNWIDFWDNYSSGSSNQPNRDRHRIYIYTQLGETTGNVINSPVWHFTGAFNDGTQDYWMTNDNNNPGWYYYDLSQNCSPKWEENTDKATSEQKSYYSIPRPGETLLIFHSGMDFDQGYTLHRASHHLDPGISLFDYEDREGYILYDPTSEPYFYVFDEKPVIEDVTYTVYSDCKPSEWFKIYGNATEGIPANDNQRYKIHSSISNATQVTVSGKQYWKTEIKLKAPRGEYAKAINVKFSNQRVYLGVYGVSWQRPPRVYFYNGSNEYTSWNNTPQMKLLSGSDGNIYYYDVPAGFENGRVIFQSGDRANKIPDSGEGYQMSAGSSNITYTNNPSYWAGYDSSSSVESVLFGGRKFSNNTGYFNTSTKKWSQTPN